jgi:hypothetical protein
VIGVDGADVTEINSTTTNNIHGPQVGFRFEYTHPWFSLGAEPKVALGVNQYKAGVASDDPLSFSLLTTETSTVFQALGHLNVFAKMKITDHIRGYVAYNLLGVSGVSRPHEQIVYDLTSADENNIHVNTKLSGFMLQGYSVGGEVNF